ncbi:MAG: type I restriction endonuclease [Verrucomicrobiota bacterium]
MPRERLAELEAELAERNKAALKQQQELDAVDAQLKQAQAELAAIREANAEKEDPHDYSEAETRRYLIDVDLRRAGWPLDQKRDQEYEVTGMPNPKGLGYADYVLWGDDGKPLAVVEAKKSTEKIEKGQQQAKLYADCLEQMHGQRPLLFFTNGYETRLWDDTFYPPRRVAGFYKKDELQRLILRRSLRQALDASKVKSAIAGRYYQKRAIGSICAHFAQHQRKALSSWRRARARPAAGSGRDPARDLGDGPSPGGQRDEPGELPRAPAAGGGGTLSAARGLERSLGGGSGDPSAPRRRAADRAAARRPRVAPLRPHRPAHAARPCARGSRGL